MPVKLYLSYDSDFLFFENFTLKAVKYIAIVLILASCNNAELENCQSENKSLLAAKAVQDSMLSSISQTYTQIDSNASIIARKKAYINELAAKGKLTKEDKEAILAQMDSINMLMSLNKEKVASLQGGLNDASLQSSFKAMLDGMDAKNEMEDVKLGDMKKDLAQVSRDFSELFEEYVYKEVENLEMKEQLSDAARELQEAQERLDQAKEQLQSGWYVIGTKEELQSKGLIYKKGFFDNKSVNEDFDKSQFKKVNIHELKEIILDSRDAEIVTTHPSESYEMVGIKKKVNKLVIKNPELFWSVSKFLIIEVDR